MRAPAAAVGPSNQSALLGPPLPLNATLLRYSALGASDAVGVGSSAPCPTNSSHMVSPPNCPGGKGYVPDLAAKLQAFHGNVTLTDLGISGALIAPDFQALAAKYGRPHPGNFEQNELPSLPAGSGDVTVFAGPNDTLAVAVAILHGAGGSDPNGYIKMQIAAFGKDYAALLQGIRRIAPSARIVVYNEPNFAGMPAFVRLSMQDRRILQSISVGFDVSVINQLTAKGVRVVDLLCNSLSYDPTRYSSDGFHPNDSGYSFMAQQGFNALTRSVFPAPSSNCPQMHIVS